MEREREMLEQIEQLIDATSVSSVLEAVQEILGLKAMHLRVNWTDPVSARVLERAAKIIDQACARVAQLGL